MVVIDIIDYRILRTVAAYHSLGPHFAPTTDLTREPAGLSEAQIERAVEKAGGAFQAR